MLVDSGPCSEIAAMRIASWCGWNYKSPRITISGCCGERESGNLSLHGYAELILNDVAKSSSPPTLGCSAAVVMIDLGFSD